MVAATHEPAESGEAASTPKRRRDEPTEQTKATEPDAAQVQAAQPAGVAAAPSKKRASQFNDEKEGKEIKRCRSESLQE